MRWLDKLERKYYKYAIPNLMQYIAGGMAIVFVFALMFPSILSMIYYSPTLVLQGQIWRLVAFIFIPRTMSPIFIIFSVLIMIFFGRIIESSWGTFKLNVYYLIGTLGTLVAGIIAEFVFGATGTVFTNHYLNMTLMLAAAQLAPDYELRIYFVLPVKLKYLGYINLAFILYELIVSSVGNRIVILLSLVNFLIFFGPGLLRQFNSTARRQQYKNAHRPKPRADVKRRQAKRQPRNGEVIQVAFHCCEVCGRTEVDDPTLEFRYCSKCEGRHEYCTDHLFDHEHKKEG